MKIALRTGALQSSNRDFQVQIMTKMDAVNESSSHQKFIIIVLNGIHTKVQWQQAWITRMFTISFLIADEWVNGVVHSTLEII